MKHDYSGNIESFSSIIDRINGGSKILFFPSNKIMQGKLENNEFEMSGLFCKAKGQINELNDSSTLDLKVRLKTVFYVLGIFIVLFMTSFLWVENVTINGDSEPTIWKRIVAVAIGLLVFLIIPRLILNVLKNDFEMKVLKLIK
ncbi:MAG: hypothetical protein WBO28_01695 [Flavobacteriales bacterium]|jgi:hypothetical protein